MVSDAEGRQGLNRVAPLRSVAGVSKVKKGCDQRHPVNSGFSAYIQNITMGPHRLFADEPAEAGDADAGPNPYELPSRTA